MIIKGKDFSKTILFPFKAIVSLNFLTLFYEFERFVEDPRGTQ